MGSGKLLVDRGADVNGIELEGRTHLDWVNQGGNADGIQQLRSLGGLLYSELNQKNEICNKSSTRAAARADFEINSELIDRRLDYYHEGHEEHEGFHS